MLASLVQRCLTTTHYKPWSIPKAISLARIRALFNQPVHAGKYGGRNADLERLGGLQIKDQFEFVWLLHRQVSGPGAPVLATRDGDRVAPKIATGICSSHRDDIYADGQRNCHRESMVTRDRPDT